jgi:Domain of unknown function (DUF3854)
METFGVNPQLDFLLSRLYDECLAPEHRTDLHKSSLTDETIALQKVRTVPPHMIDQLLRFEAPKVQHAYLIPFPDPRGGWMEHVRMKIFPSITTATGTIRYLQPRRSGVRIYFPLATLDAVLHSTDPAYLLEGEKKALSVAQLGLPAIGISGIEGWHIAGSRDLHPDLDDVGLCGRIVKVVPDADVRTNPAVNRAVHRLAAALERRGAVVEIAVLPLEVSHV